MATKNTISKPTVTTSAAAPDKDWVQIGGIARVHGLRGVVLTKLFNDDSDTLRAGLSLKLVHKGGVVRDVVVASFENGRLALEGVADRNAAELLRGAEMWCRRSEFADPDALYLVDLLGVAAVDQAGVALGVIAGFRDLGPQTLLVVKTADGRECDVPYVAHVVIEASRTRVVLAPPVGLFDLDDDAAADDGGDDDA